MQHCLHYTVTLSSGRKSFYMRDNHEEFLINPPMRSNNYLWGMLSHQVLYKENQTTAVLKPWLVNLSKVLLKIICHMWQGRLAGVQFLSIISQSLVRFPYYQVTCGSRLHSITKGVGQRLRAIKAFKSEIRDTGSQEGWISMTNSWLRFLSTSHFPIVRLGK